MVEQVLFFIAGALTAAFFWLLLLPILSRRAMRLSILRLEQALPMTYEEVLADKDRLRASHAVEKARLEQIISEYDAKITKAKTTIAQLRVEKVALEEKVCNLSEKMQKTQAE